MRLIDYATLLLILLLLLRALRSMRNARKQGKTCTGYCATCGKNCGNRDSSR